MSMISATVDPQTATVVLETTFAGVDNATTWRYVNGVPTEVRAFKLSDSGEEIPPDRDYEAPLGVVVGYANALWTTVKPSPPPVPEVTVVLNVPDTDGWIKFPAYPERNFKIGCITKLPQRRFDSNVGLFRIIGRQKPIAVHDVMTWWKGSIEWLAASQFDHDNQVEYLTTGSIFLIQTMPAYGGIHEYAYSEGLKTSHAAYARSESPEREMILEFQTTDEPVGAFTVQIRYTYSQMDTDWATYADLPTNYQNYYTLLRNDVL